MYNFSQFICVSITFGLLASCSWIIGGNSPTSPFNTGILIQTGSRLTGSVMPPEAQFKDIIKILEDTKNYNEFAQKYSIISPKIDEWALQWSGAYVFDHNIVDKLIPFLYICRFTLSGDESAIRSNFIKYATIIPPIIANNNTSQDIISQFTSTKISLDTLYTVLVSPQVSLPQYYIDLISSRKSTQWKIINDDCDRWVSQYEKTFFSEK